ncbi:MAG: hypothetical protein GF399_03270 [Candidatus Coatesbacteria bacterium]|jgi:competence protein ComGC|nr:hypothetical protein [Candidatus Coatesbacteria bacterium]
MTKADSQTQKKKHLPWVEILIFLALAVIVFAVVQPNFAEYDQAIQTTQCKENQHNIQQAVYLWLNLNGKSTVSRGVGEEGDVEVHDIFGNNVTGMLHYSDTHPNAQDLIAMGVDESILICPEVGPGENCLGRHYCYKDSDGAVECAVDATGKARLLTDEINPQTGEFITAADYYHD